jgi:hypothetical protein
MASLEQQLAALAAREAIRDLPRRYCDCVWRDDIDGIVDLFTADGTFVAEMGGKTYTFKGREELRRMFVNGLGIQPRPYIHNHVVELNGESFASGRCYLDLHSARNNMEFMGAGYYTDEYMATPRGWKFLSRHFVAVRMDDIPQGLDTP